MCASGPSWPQPVIQSVNQRRVPRSTWPGPEAEPFSHTGPEALEQDIRAGDELQSEVSAPRRLQVERYPAPVTSRGIKAHIGPAERIHRIGIYVLQTVDADDVRPEVPQQHPRKGHRANRRQLQHADPSQRTCTRVSEHPASSRLSDSRWTRSSADLPWNGQ